MGTSVVFQESPKGPRAELIKAMVDERIASQQAKNAAEEAAQSAGASAANSAASAQAAADSASEAGTGAGAAAISAEAANASAIEASVQAVAAESQRAAADAARIAAEVARDAAAAAADIYPSTAAGVAAVAVGGYFSVAVPGTNFLSLYRVDAGPVATLVNTYLSATGVTEEITKATEQTGPFFYNGTRYLIVVTFDDGKFVPFMDENGRPVLMDIVTGEIEPVPSSQEREKEIANQVAKVASDDGPIYFGGERARLAFDLGDGMVVPVIDDNGRLVGWNPDTGKMFLVGNQPAGALRSADLRSSPSIVWLSNSLAHGAYNLPGKFWLQHLSGLTDWQIHNFSLSGYEVEDGYYDLEGNTVVGNDSLGIRDLSPAYIVIGDIANSNWRWRNTSDYIAAVERLILGIKAVGAVPIIQTEPRNNPPEVLAALMALAVRDGLIIVDVSSARVIVGGDLPTDYNQGGISGGVDYTHPGTRTQWVLVEALRRTVETLPRPTSSIKLWRARNTGATLTDLLFDDDWGRFDRWTPLPVACRDLAPSSYADFDNLQNPVTFVVTEDGHLNLAAGAATDFPNYALLSAVVNGTATSLDEVRIGTGVVDPAVTAYVRSQLQPMPYNPHDISQWTVVEVSANPGITAGAIYSNGFETLTFVGSATHPDGTQLAVFTPAISTLRGAIIYTKQSGTGPASFAGLWQGPGRPPAFYEALSAPRSVWSPVVLSAGELVLSGSALQAAMDGDRVDILLVKSGSITMTASPVVSWSEPRMHKQLPAPVVSTGKGNVLADMLMTDAAWSMRGDDGAILGVPAPAAPTDGWVPPGVSSAVAVSNANRLSLDVDLEPDALEPSWVAIEVWARHAPAQFSGPVFPGTSEITLTSLDHRKLAVRLTDASGDGRVHFMAVERIGLAWWRTRYRVSVPPLPLWGGVARRIEIYSPDGTVLVGRVRIIKE